MTILVYYTCRHKYAHTHIADMNMPLVSNSLMQQKIFCQRLTNQMATFSIQTGSIGP